ncbi:MAG: hypothetical protein QOD76_230, partial [Solirubrobacteraceae bacterium]|nr:hypothetical protein [Solirubrobacteraceae bacterium]
LDHGGVGRSVVEQIEGKRLNVVGLLGPARRAGARDRGDAIAGAGARVDEVAAGEAVGAGDQNAGVQEADSLTAACSRLPCPLEETTSS